MQFRLTLLASLALLLGGCYKWEASDNPISGIKLVTPSTAEFEGGTFAVFSGSVIANDVDSVRYGIVYKPVGYEAYSDSALYQFAPIDTIISVHVEGTQANNDTFRLSVPSTTLPGRYVFFSYAKDKSGNRSDSNLVSRKITSSRIFPGLASSVPAFPALNVVETPISRNRGDIVSLSFSAYDSVGFSHATLSACQVIPGRSLTCSIQRVIRLDSLLDKTTYIDTVSIELPPSALATQQYRARVQLTNTRGYQYSWQPLYQINNL